MLEPSIIFLKQLFQYNDVWWRYEFAKSHGEIHIHSIICSSKHARKVHDALQCGQLLDEEQPNNHSEQQIRSEAAEQLRKWLQTTESDEQDTFSPQFVSMHPAGGHEVCNDLEIEHGSQIKLNGLSQKEHSHHQI